MESRSPKQEKTVVYDGSLAGRRRLTHHYNYHTHSNNAVLPAGDAPDVEHYHSKVVRGGRAARLMPTLRENSATGLGDNISRDASDERFRVPSNGIRELEKPDYQIKKPQRKKALAPTYARARQDSLLGAAMQIISSDQDGNGIYNPNTRAYYNGRKK